MSRPSIPALAAGASIGAAYAAARLTTGWAVNGWLPAALWIVDWSVMCAAAMAVGWVLGGLLARAADRRRQRESA